MRCSCGLEKKDSSHAGNGQFPPEVSTSVSAGLSSSSDHGAAVFSFSLMLEALNSFRVTLSPIAVARSLSEGPNWHRRTRPVYNVRLRRFEAMGNRGASLRERTQAVHTFIRVLPLPVPAMLKTRTPLVGYASRASASVSAAIFCHARRLSGSAGRKAASSEQGCRPVRGASGRSTRFTMRQTRSAASSGTRDKRSARRWFKRRPSGATYVLAKVGEVSLFGGHLSADTV